MRPPAALDAHCRPPPRPALHILEESVLMGETGPQRLNHTITSTRGPQS